MTTQVGTLQYNIVGNDVTVYKDTNGDPIPCYARNDSGGIEWQGMMAANSTDQQILDACDAYLTGTKGWC